MKNYKIVRIFNRIEIKFYTWGILPNMTITHYDKLDISNWNVKLIKPMSHIHRIYLCLVVGTKFYTKIIL